MNRCYNTDTLFISSRPSGVHVQISNINNTKTSTNARYSRALQLARFRAHALAASCASQRKFQCQQQLSTHARCINKRRIHSHGCRVHQKHRRVTRPTYIEWVPRSASFSVWRVLSSSLCTGCSEYRSKPGLDRSPRYAECEIACPDGELGAVWCYGGGWQGLKGERRRGEGEEG